MILAPLGFNRWQSFFSFLSVLYQVFENPVLSAWASRVSREQLNPPDFY